MFNFEPRTIVEENLDCLLRKKQTRRYFVHL